MGDGKSSKNIRFNINSSCIRGSIVLTFEPHIISLIKDEIDSFIISLNNKKNKNNIHIKAKGNTYEMNLKAFPAICNKVFSILKDL